VAFSVTVTALDPFGNTATGYAGTVHFTSSDSQPTLPADYPFTTADAGVHTFSGVILRTAGTQTITVTDTVNPSLSGSASVNVLPPGAPRNRGGRAAPPSFAGASPTLALPGQPADGVELWKADGTAAATTTVADLNPGSGRSNPANLTNVNGVLFFTANDGADSTELWKSGRAAAGTVMVADIEPGSANSSPLWLTDLNGTLFFSAADGTHHRELLEAK
jgi:ELWxxDGT repeat protein